MDQLKEKARQILQAEEVINLYNKFERTNDGPLDEMQGQEDLLNLASLLYMFGNSMKFIIIQNGHKAAIAKVLKAWKGKENEPGFVTDVITISRENILRVFDSALELKAAGLPIVIWPDGMKPEETKLLKINDPEAEGPEAAPADFMQVGSMKHYYEFTRLLAGGQFSLPEGRPWPSAAFPTIKGEVSLKPIEADRRPVMGDQLARYQALMQDKVKELERHGHLAADVFDILVNKWLKVARYPEAMVKISINDFLEVRGLKSKKRGEDKRSGYTDAQRQQIADQIDLLDSIFVTIEEMEVYPKGKKKKASRGLSGRSIIKDMQAGQMDISGQVKADEWYIRPGSIFSNYFFQPYGRQTALLSLKAVKYDPYRQKWEKSLSRYFAYLWRVDEGRTREGLLVSTLLAHAGEPLNEGRPSRTRERLEKALDQLKEDDIISGWEYENKQKAGTAGRGWWKLWLEQKIILQAPAEITEQYKEIKGK